MTMNPSVSTVFAFLVSIVAHPDLRAQNPAVERIVVRTVLPAGEQPYLLVSPLRTSPFRVPGTALDLAVDPTLARLLPIDSFGERGAQEIAFALPREVDLSAAAMFAQVVGVSAQGPRALPVFRLTSGDRAVTPVAKPQQLLPESLESNATAGHAKELGRAIQVSRNPALGTTIFTVDGRPLSGRAHAEVEGQAPSNVGPVELMAPAMSGLSLTATPSSYPSRVHGRIIINWPDGSSGQGSGTLIDAKHVITAGHVVYQAAKGGWATTLTFVPAYDNGDKPYGSGISASGLGWRHSWTNWTQDGDNTHDVAYFQIDRPVGALTSWHGYGYSTDCDFYLTTTFYTRSYPGESPYNGQLMYQRSGTFDSCPNEREARFDLYSYGGESGAGYYYLNANGNRYVRAVGSHRNSNPTSADRVRLTESKFDNIGDTLAAAKASTFDFTPLGVTVGPTASPRVAAGSALPDLDFVAHNYSTATFSGTLNWTVRLSTNTTISTGDTLLRTTSATATVGPNSSWSINHGNPPTIPATVAPGTYYVGIILTTVDANSGNQITLADDVATVIIE
jgi:V8-like Glu-specific endopeptidase